MFKQAKNTPIQENQEQELDFFEYKEVSDKNNKQIKRISNYYRGLLDNNKIFLSDFVEYIKNILKQQNILKESIKGTNFNNNTFNIHLNNGEIINFTLSSLKEFIITKTLSGVKPKEIEKKSENIQKAIESIFEDNHGLLINGEIDDKDIIKTDEYGKDLKGKTLKELKVLLDIENKKLYDVYKITGETNKKRELLKTELKFYTGLGDKYEGGARYFSMTKKQINDKVSKLVNSMSFEEIFDYIRNSNKTINSNIRISDMADKVNSKFLDSLYRQTFERLKKENTSNIDFIKFITAITGRGKLEIEKNEQYSTKTEFNYKNLDMSDKHKDTSLANQALTYVMYKKGGVLEEIIKNKSKEKITIVDEELEGRTPNQLMNETLNKLNSLNTNIPNHGELTLKKAGFGHLIGTQKNYNQLSFEDKVSIGSVARILKIVQESTTEELRTPGFIENKSKDVVENAFNELNESLSDNFNESWGDINGITGSELGLKGELGEIFNLYQDINGNNGVFDFKDDNSWTPGTGSIVMGVGLIAGVIIMSPLLTGAVPLTILASAIAGAKLGLITGVAANVFSHQGYDSLEEGAIDISAQLATDIVFSMLFTVAGLGILSKFFKNINPDLFASKNAWSGAGFTDKGFIVGEVGTTGFIVSPWASAEVKDKYYENYFDTEKGETYHKELENNKSS